MGIKIIAVLLVILLYIVLIFFYGPDIMNLAADFSAWVIAKAEKKINAALERWHDILEDK